MTSALQEMRSHMGTGNADPILREIRHALARLLHDGTETVIDLGAIPFAGGDERVLDSILGVGEVTATVNVLGESRVQETAIAGVWRIDHFDEAGETLSRFVEVTFLPGILKTQKEDAAQGLALLDERLQDRPAATAT